LSSARRNEDDGYQIVEALYRDAPRGQEARAAKGISGVTRFAFLGASNDLNTTTFVQATQAAANPIGARPQSVLVPGAEEFEAAFASIVKEQRRA